MFKLENIVKHRMKWSQKFKNYALLVVLEVRGTRTHFSPNWFRSRSFVNSAFFPSTPQKQNTRSLTNPVAYRETCASMHAMPGVQRGQMAPEARSKFGVPMLEPTVFRKQVTSTCDTGNFRRPGFCPFSLRPCAMHRPVATGDIAPPNWNMKHYKSVQFCQF